MILVDIPVFIEFSEELAGLIVGYFKSKRFDENVRVVFFVRKDVVDWRVFAENIKDQVGLECFACNAFNVTSRNSQAHELWVLLSGFNEYWFVSLDAEYNISEDKISVSVELLEKKSKFENEFLSTLTPFGLEVLPADGSLVESSSPLFKSLILKYDSFLCEFNALLGCSSPFLESHEIAVAGKCDMGKARLLEFRMLSSKLGELSKKYEPHLSGASSYCSKMSKLFQVAERISLPRVEDWSSSRREVVLAYHWLSAYMLFVAKINYMSAQHLVSFLCVFRALECYIDGLLFHVGKLKVQQFSSGYYFVFDGSKIKGFWPKWEYFTQLENYKDKLLDSYISARNGMSLVHGVATPNVSMVNNFLERVHILISRVGPKYWESDNYWNHFNSAFNKVGPALLLEGFYGDVKDALASQV